MNPRLTVTTTWRIRRVSKGASTNIRMFSCANMTGANSFLFVARPFSVVLEEELVEDDEADGALNSNKSQAHCEDVLAKDTGEGRR